MDTINVVQFSIDFHVHLKLLEPYNTKDEILKGFHVIHRNDDLLALNPIA